MLERTDNAAVAQMIRRVFEDYNALRPGTVYFDPTTDNLFDFFQEPGSVLWVANIGKELVGCAGIFPTQGLPAGYCEFVKFYVSSAHQGIGIGRLLLDQTIASAEQFRYTHMYLESIPEFSNAVSIYEKLGFVRLAAPLGNSGHFGCSIWMVKEL